MSPKPTGSGRALIVCLAAISAAAASAASAASTASGRRIGSIVPVGCPPHGGLRPRYRRARRSDGTLECAISPDWWVTSGPNGGYVAAILVRALEAAAGARTRPLRSLTGALPARARRALGFARGVRGARGALGQLRAGAPAARGPAMCRRDGRAGRRGGKGSSSSTGRPRRSRLPRSFGAAARRQASFAEQFEYRSAFSGAPDAALTGGWLRPRTPHPLDAALLVALCDAWIPAVFVVTREPRRVPTLELTVHLRSGAAAPAGLGPRDSSPAPPARACSRRAARSGRATAGCWPSRASWRSPFRAVCDIAQKPRRGARNAHEAVDLDSTGERHTRAAARGAHPSGRDPGAGHRSTSSSTSSPAAAWPPARPHA